MKKFFASPLFAIIALGIASLGFSCVIFIGYNYVEWRGDARIAEWGAFGDFFGGVFGTIISLITIYFVYKTFSQQKLEATQRETEQQDSKNAEEKSEIENRFLKLLELHRLNVSEMKSGEKTEVLTGREVFGKMYVDFFLIHEWIIENFKILGKKVVEGELHPLETQSDSLNVAYYLFSFGIKKDGPGIRNYKVQDILKGYEPKKIELFLAEVDQMANTPPFNVFRGCQYLLSHYHRHLYQMVRYIDGQKLLNLEEKYHYISILRAQLDPYEQVILFYNTLSYLGKAWEIRNEEAGNRLITRYNLIRNMFRATGKHSEPHIFYGSVDFEYLNDSARKHIADMRKTAGYIYDKTLLGE